VKAFAPSCPQCGQSLQSIRFGVRLRPIWVRIVDVIVRAGPDGISGADLRGVIYGDASVTRNVISVHVNHINAALESTDYRIRCGRGNGNTYRMVRLNNGGEHDRDRETVARHETGRAGVR